MFKNFIQVKNSNLKIMNSEDILKTAINLKNTKKETVVIVDRDDNIIGSSDRMIMVNLLNFEWIEIIILIEILKYIVEKGLINS